MHKEFALGTFLDIEEAFSRVRSEAVVKAFEKFEMESIASYKVFFATEWS